METDKLTAIGKELGLSGSGLKQWIDEERAREREAREARLAERNAAKEADAEALARLQAEKEVLELRLKLRELDATTGSMTTGHSAEGARMASPESYESPHKLIPPFNEVRDKLDAYIQRFERVARSQDWPQDKWALSLSLCLTGEALSVVGRMEPDHAMDYATLKQTLLQRFRFTEERYRTKFRSAKPENCETGRQFAGRILGYFDHWQEMAKTERTYDALRDIIVSEQFLMQCHEKLAIFLRERNCQGIEKLAEAADHYMEAQGFINLGKVKNENYELDKPADEARAMPRKEKKEKLQCFLCGKRGHKAADCWTSTKGPRTKPTFCRKCRRSGHSKEDCPNKESGRASCLKEQAEGPKASNLKTQAFRQGTDCSEHGKVKREDKSMPTAEGVLGNQPVTVLRDTGCDSVIVRRSLVPASNLTGKVSSVCLLDRRVLKLPEADVQIVSPFFTGKARAICMDDPL
uniref:Putative tick transposon n=1 Tax=Rhipicephalus pulchellus TaxID=72859 RepID=L7M186_RHIPC